MIDFIYSIPPFVLRLSINAVILCILLGSALLVKRHITHHNDDHEAVNGVSSIVSVMYAIFIGFVIFSSVNNLQTATEAARTEAHIVSTINYDASFFSASTSMEVRKILQAYLHDVIEQEWPAMQAGQVNNAALQPLYQLKDLILARQPNSLNDVQVHLWTDLIRQTNNLFQEHEDRMHYAKDLSLNSGVWYCLILATIMMLVSSSFFHFVDRRKYFIMIICIGVITGLLLFLQTSINFPYRGYYGVTSTGYQALLTQLDLW